MRIATLLAFTWIGREIFVSSFVTPRLEYHHRTLTSTCIQASPEPLESEGDWSAYLDVDTTGLVYYFNVRTGESRWEPPSPTFPQVYLTPRNRRRAQRVREEYLKLQQQQKQAQAVTEEKKVSIFSSILDKRDDVRNVETRQEPDWFAGLFEETKQAKEATRVVVETKKKVEKEEEPNWFGSLFETSKKAEEPNWFGNLFEAPTKEEEPNWFGNLFDTPKSKNGEEPNWFDNLFETPKKSNEEPNWFASIFDDTQINEKSVEQPKIVRAVEPEPTKVEQQAPTWVKDRWLGGSAAQQPAPVAEEPKLAPGVVGKPQKVEEEQGEKPKRKQLLSKIFGRGKKDVGEPSDDGDAPVNGDLDATLAPPEVTDDTKKKPKGKADVAVKERKVVVEEKAAPQIEVAPRKKVTVKPEEPKIIVPDKEVPINIDMSAYVLPHPMKILWGGEDAVFTKGRTFGVFDGVSGANKTDGVALYSKTMANRMRKAVGKSGLTTTQLTETMLEAVKFADARATGATTAIVASIDGEGFLHALNVGDSTCIVVRDGKIAAQTKEKVHFFECPYQLGKDLPDRPKDGSKLTTKLRRGDIIVMGSDGVFDNVSENEVAKIVSNAPPRSSLMAKRIVDLSRRISLDPKADTPFAKLAKKKGDRDYQSGVGGKLDDVSCIVVRYY
jgi:protein phosphatase PTC7